MQGENAKKAVAEFKGRMSVEVGRQEKLEMAEKKYFRREELLEKYIAKMLYEWNNGKFKKEYLRKLEKKLMEVEVCFFGGETLKGG